MLEIPKEITYDSLVKEAKESYAKLDDKAWDLLITQRGINHIDDKLLQEFIDGIPEKLSKLYEQLETGYDTNPTTEQVIAINANLFKLEQKKTPLTQSLQTVKNAELAKSKDYPKLTEESKAVIQEAANAVAKVDGKIDEVQKPLQIAGEISECERCIGSIKEKFACAINEQRLRSGKDAVKREFIHSTYYLDFTAHSGHLTGQVTFTNGSATVTGDAHTVFTTELANGDYVRAVSNGTQWYKVTARGANNSMTITPVYQQATVTDTDDQTLASVSATQDGTTTTKAFCHLNRYTTDTARTAGDILKVRANQTNVIAGINITFDEAGTVIAYNEIRGCSVADDPFSDASNVQPIFDFGNTAFQVQCYQSYWKFYNLDITNNNLTSSGLFSTTGKNTLDTCTIHLNNHASGYGVSTDGYSTNLTISNSIIYSNKKYNISAVNGMTYVDSCTINGGAAGTSYGMFTGNGHCRASNTTFGVTTAHSTADLYGNIGSLTIRNCLYSTISVGGFLICTSEDDGQVLGAAKAYYYSGTITKCASGLTDSTVRAGGGLSSALMMPSSVCTIKYPLTIAYGSLMPDMCVECAPSTTYTVTVYIRGSATWGTFPTNAQLFIQADYYAGATSLRSQSTPSTQVIADNSTWVGFTTTFTTGATGSNTYAYIKVNLGLYASGKGVYVDTLAVRS
jgi:hypothetical protein